VYGGDEDRVRQFSRAAEQREQTAGDEQLDVAGPPARWVGPVPGRRGVDQVEAASGLELLEGRL